MAIDTGHVNELFAVPENDHYLLGASEWCDQQYEQGSEAQIESSVGM